MNRHERGDRTQHHDIAAAGAKHRFELECASHEAADVHAHDATELVEVIFADPVRHDIVALRQDENIESVEGRGIAVDRRAGQGVNLPEMQTSIIKTKTATR